MTLQFAATAPSSPYTAGESRDRRRMNRRIDHPDQHPTWQAIMTIRTRLADGTGLTADQMRADLEFLLAHIERREGGR